VALEGESVRIRRAVVTAAVIVLAALATWAMAGCERDEADPPTTPTPVSTPASAGSQAAVPSSDATADTGGTIAVTWTAIDGDARQDPIGLLSGTPLVAQGTSLRAHRTVKFTPNAADAESAKGKYVYDLDLHADPSDPDAYTGTMHLDWTMTIVRANSKNEFHAVYKANVTATFDSAGRAVYDSFAHGSAKTTDTFSSGGSVLPANKSSTWFVWGFKTPG
jgi:hypothetical protein